jgi:hypothetical protein
MKEKGTQAAETRLFVFMKRRSRIPAKAVMRFLLARRGGNSNRVSMGN